MIVSSRRNAGWLYLAFILVAILTASQLHADSMRCGQRVIRTGDSPALLLERCGEPLHRGKAYAEVKTKDGPREVRVDQWHYKKNERSLERIVLLYRGEIVSIHTGSR